MLFVRKEHRVSDEDKDGSQDEGHKQLDVDVVPGAVQLPEEQEDDGMCAFRVCLTNVFAAEERGEEPKFSPEQTEDGDGDGEGDERQRVADGVHCLHEGKIPVGI